MEKKYTERQILFENLYQIIKRLREPDGCAWDLKQNAETLRKDLLEETYECIDAIDKQDDKHLQEELGDLLLMIIMLTRIKEQEKSFTLSDVIQGISDKLIRRHPHVFAKQKVNSIDEIIQNWDTIKENVEGKKNEFSIFEKIPSALPPLEKAYKIQEKAAKVDFEWDTIDPVFDKLDEEIKELVHEYKQGDKRKMEEETGDVFFTVVNIARMLKINPALALNRTNKKFIRRFQEIEQILKDRKIDIKKAGIQLLDQLWDEIKTREKGGTTDH